MASLSFADRVVEVIVDRGEEVYPQYRYGSGFIIAGRTVLTAGHVVSGAAAVSVRFPDKREVPALFDERFVVVTSGLDLALVEIDDAVLDLPSLPVARVDRAGADAELIERVQVVGYPEFREHPEFGRETAHAAGHIPVLAGLVSGLLTVQVTSAPRPLPDAQSALRESEWSGMSGAPVLADGCLLGVVSEHAIREGPSAITAVPVTMLDADAAHPGWGTGVDNAAAWWARLGVTNPAGLRRLPAHPQRTPPEYWATVREIHARTPQLIGREAELAQIVEFATGPPGYRWLIGDAWAGKTALLAEAVDAALPPEVNVAAYFASRLRADADGNRFLAAVVPQLEHLLDVDRAAPDQHRLRYLWDRAVERTAADGRQLLLVVDGLDEDLHPPDVPSIASLLPTRLGSCGHVLVASRPPPELSDGRPELPDDVDVVHPLQTTNRVLLDGSQEAGHLADLARQELRHLLRAQHLEGTVDVLGVLTAAAGPLGLNDVATLVGDLAPVTSATLVQVGHVVVEQAARTLRPVGTADRPRYTFAHPQLFEQAQTDPYLSHRSHRERIYRWAQSWRALGWPILAGQDDSTPHYLLDEYPATLKGEPDRLVELAVDVGWVIAALHTVGVDRLLADFSPIAKTSAAAAPVVVLRVQADNLRLADDLAYLLRHLCLGALELGEDHLAAEIRGQLQALPDTGPVPLWSTRRISPALITEFTHPGVRAVTGLPDGRVASAGIGLTPALVWDPAAPDAPPAQLGGDFNAGVWVVTALPDGRLAGGGGDGAVCVWDPDAPGAPPIELGRRDDTVLALAVTPDGQVISGGGDGAVCVWDPDAPGAPPIELGRHDDWVPAVVSTPHGRVISGGFDGRVLVWDLAVSDGAPTELGRHEDAVWAMTLAPDGRVVSGGADGQILLWDPDAPGTPPMELDRHDDGVRALVVASDGRLVSAGNDHRLLLHDLAVSDGAPTELGRHEDAVWAMTLAPDGRVVSCGADERVVLWDSEAPGTPLIEPDGHNPVRAVVVTADGRVAGGGDDRRVLIWDPASLDTLPTELGCHDEWVSAVAAIPDGRVVSGGADGQILLWDPAMPGAPPTELGRHHDMVRALAGIADGRVVSCGEDDKRVLLWDPDAPGTPPIELGRHEYAVQAVAEGPDGRVVSGGWDKRVLLWDPDAPGTPPIELGRHEYAVQAVAEGPDGWVVSGDVDGRILLWDAGTPGAAPIELDQHDDAVRAVAMSPDGRVVSAGRDRWVLILDPYHPGVASEISCASTDIAFVPGHGLDGPRFVIAHEGNGISMWSLPLP